MLTYSFANQKGGVGKTAFAVHKALAAADAGQRVLFIDFDGQGNSTASLKDRAGLSPFEAIQLFDTKPPPGIEAALSERFECCVVDTPPTLGLRLVAALTLAHYVFCPFELSSYSVQGIGQMITAIQGVKSKLNPKLEFLGMLPNRVNSRSSAHRAAIKDLYGHFAEYIIMQPMVNRVSVQEAMDQGKAVWELKSGAARAAAKEMRAALDKIDELAAKCAHG